MRSDEPDVSVGFEILRIRPCNFRGVSCDLLADDMLNDKAHENLGAGEILLARGLVNAAASRYYYSMYQAAVHRLTRLGIRPGNVRSGAVEWDHSMVENNAMQLRGRWSDRLLYRQCRARRVEADYTDIPVREIDLRECRADIAEFVGDLTR